MVEGNLPAVAVRLVGRDAEVSTVVELVHSNRLVEIVGPGGVGKTAGLAAGRRLTDPGGVWLVRLEAATTAAEVIDATVAALRVTGGEAALIERLRTAPTVLVIDNCEYVPVGRRRLDRSTAEDAAPDVRVLCTSQAPLGVAGSCQFVLTPLTCSTPSRCSPSARSAIASSAPATQPTSPHSASAC